MLYGVQLTLGPDSKDDACANITAAPSPPTTSDIVFIFFETFTGKVLMSAAHQGLQGLAAGFVATEARFGRAAYCTAAALYAMTVPMGAAVGAGIASVETETEMWTRSIQGTIGALAAGALAYVASVSLLSIGIGRASQASGGGKVLIAWIGFGIMAAAALLGG